MSVRNTIVNLVSQVFGVLGLSNGGTGDGTNFSWTGSTKTLIANAITGDGTSPLAISTPNNGSGAAQAINVTAGNSTGSASGASINITAGSGNNGASNGGAGGNCALTGGAATGTGRANGGAFALIGGATASASSAAHGGQALLQGGASSAAAAGGAAKLVGGANTGTGKAGNAVMYPGWGTASSTDGYAAIQDADGNNVVEVLGGLSQSTGLGFWAATPIAQPTTASASATYASVGGGNIQVNDTFDGYTIAQLVKAMRQYGLIN